MNTSAPSNDISIYDRMRLKGKNVGTFLTIIKRLMSENSIDIRADGQPDITEFTPSIQDKKGILRFNCGGNLCTLYAPLGNRAKNLNQFIRDIDWGASGPGSAKSHIIEPDDSPTPIPDASPGGRERRAVPEDPSAPNPYDAYNYRDLVRAAIK